MEIRDALGWLSGHWLRLLFVLGYLGVLAHHCRAARRETKGLSDFLVAGGTLGGWVVALSFYATFVSTNTFLGHAGKSWDVGLIWCAKGGVMVTAAYVAWYVVAPRFFDRARAYRSLTVPDFLGHRYGSAAVRRAAAIVVVAASALYVVAVYKGSATALTAFLGIDYRVAAGLIFLVVTGYTLAGGFRSVVATDAVQAILMLVGAITILIAVLHRGGGLGHMLTQLEAQDPAMTSLEGRMPLLAILGLAIAGGMKLLVDPRQISRIYGLRDHKALRVARVVSPLLIAVTYVCLLPIGAFARTLIPAEAIGDSDAVMPYLLGHLEILGPVASAFFLLVLLAAAMSSLDSVLLVAASSIGRDLLILSDVDPRAIRRTRIWIVLISLTGMLLALDPFGDIVSITAFSGSLYAACLLPTLVFGLGFEGATATGALAALLTGAVTVVAWYLGRRAGWVTLHEVYVGSLVSCAVYFVVSALTAGGRSRAARRSPIHTPITSSPSAAAAAMAAEEPAASPRAGRA